MFKIGVHITHTAHAVPQNANIGFYIFIYSTVDAILCKKFINMIIRTSLNNDIGYHSVVY